MPAWLSRLGAATGQCLPQELLLLVASYYLDSDRLIVRFNNSGIGNNSTFKHSAGVHAADPAQAPTQDHKDDKLYNDVQIWSASGGSLLEDFSVPRYANIELQCVLIPDDFYTEHIRPPPPSDALASLEGFGMLSFRMSAPGSDKSSRISLSALAWHKPPPPVPTRTQMKDVPANQTNLPAAVSVPPSSAEQMKGRAGWVKLHELARLSCHSADWLHPHVVLLPGGRLLTPTSRGVLVWEVRDASARARMLAELRTEGSMVPQTVCALDSGGRFIAACTWSGSDMTVYVWELKTFRTIQTLRLRDKLAAPRQWFEFLPTGLPGIFAHIVFRPNISQTTRDSTVIRLYRLTHAYDHSSDAEALADRTRAEWDAVIASIGRPWLEAMDRAVFDSRASLLTPVAIAVAPGRLLVRTPTLTQPPPSAPKSEASAEPPLLSVSLATEEKAAQNKKPCERSSTAGSFSIWDAAADRFEIVHSAQEASRENEANDDGESFFGVHCFATAKGPTFAFLGLAPRKHSTIRFRRLLLPTSASDSAEGPVGQPRWSSDIAPTHARSQWCAQTASPLPNIDLL